MGGLLDRKSLLAHKFPRKVAKVMIFEEASQSENIGVSYPGRKVEDTTERVDPLVEYSKDDTLCVTVVGPNNLHCESATDSVVKYQDLMREFADRWRKVAVCGIII